MAGATGPMIGAATAETNWRWLFRMNYPAAVVIAIPVWAFLTQVNQSHNYSRPSLFCEAVS